VSLTGILGFLFVLLVFGLVIVLAFAGRNHPARHLRPIKAFTKLRRAVGLAVEAGTRMHISLGRGNITGMEAVSGFVGLNVQERVARAASVSDRPPIATSGNGALGILSRDTFSGVYRSLRTDGRFDPTLGHVVGLTPFSYAAGTLPIIHDEHVTANVLMGHFGAEIALINEAAERSGSLVIAGTDNIAAQAAIYAIAQEPLIGEELYASGAYLGAGPLYESSLRTQDILRMLLIALILLAVILRFFGFHEPLLNLLPGIFT
jgi:hypothetical protein